MESSPPTAGTYQVGPRPREEICPPPSALWNQQLRQLSLFGGVSVIRLPHYHPHPPSGGQCQELALSLFWAASQVPYCVGDTWAPPPPHLAKSPVLVVPVPLSQISLMNSCLWSLTLSLMSFSSVPCLPSSCTGVITSHIPDGTAPTLWGGHDETRRPSRCGVSKRTPSQGKCSSSQSLQDEAQRVSEKGQRREGSRQKGQRMQGICQNLGGPRMDEGSRGRAQ